ncbi:hypothetical protein EHQ92_06340 [Leptospira biflexa]|jgi:hypothetical protein|uniref:hypothetical protein n=1 Tax=Leptospira biflexa TaxID=172 RepID=UPI001082C83E|nr:hypothetical protein [Leptospira biflexa]TGM37994.1 hypothetical protein EHQ80_10525 [Leptospira biflexa]TGM41325.1 hypothetical protein EHQ89_05090 [Leptospira biflexa]TGM47528.1 hypothetical protein EHQ92_06340 [Leptospira biflexa]TGM50006.1 hypothetical protein EHQ88_06745 [Leptospira biflexa]
MRLKMLLSLGLLFVSFGFVLNAEKKVKSVKEMNLHDFMEDYTKPATKLYDKKDNADYLNKILEKVPDMAPEDQKAEWKEIIDAKLAVGKPDETCKSCHTKFKKEYKKNYRKKLIQVPDELLGFPKEIKELLKK